MIKKALCFISAIALCVSACGCGNDNSDKIGVVTPFDNEEDEIYFVTNTDIIEFPDFLSEKESISKFSRIVYTSFDYDKTNSLLDDAVSVDGGYDCDMSFSNGKLLRFKYKENFGIVDSNGNVKLQGVYSSIKQLRPDLFELVYNGNKTYATIDENYDFVFIEDDSFKWVFEDNKLEIVQATIETAENVADVPEGMKYNLKTPDGKIVYDKSFDSIAETSKDTLEIECEYFFTAYSGGSCYYIVFDEFYNYKVFEGSYGNVNVEINGDKGECYILSYEHLLQIVNLFSCFDFKQNSAIVPSENCISFDFISVKNGQVKYSICDNGYCQITTLSEENNEYVDTVYEVSGECFADVLDWIDKILSTEYVK